MRILNRIKFPWSKCNHQNIAFIKAGKEYTVIAINKHDWLYHKNQFITASVDILKQDEQKWLNLESS